MQVKQVVFVTETFQEQVPNARLALIEARRLVKLASEYRSQYSEEELRPYAVELEKLVRLLIKDLRPESKLRGVLKNLFSGGEK